MLIRNRFTKFILVISSELLSMKLSYLPRIEEVPKIRFSIPRPIDAYSWNNNFKETYNFFKERKRVHRFRSMFLDNGDCLHVCYSLRATLYERTAEFDPGTGGGTTRTCFINSTKMHTLFLAHTIIAWIQVTRVCLRDKKSTSLLGFSITLSRDQEFSNPSRWFDGLHFSKFLFHPNR